MHLSNLSLTWNSPQLCITAAVCGGHSSVDPDGSSWPKMTDPSAISAVPAIPAKGPIIRPRGAHRHTSISTSQSPPASTSLHPPPSSHRNPASSPPPSAPFFAPLLASL
jgi:hypothetical protein